MARFPVPLLLAVLLFPVSLSAAFSDGSAFDGFFSLEPTRDVRIETVTFRGLQRFPEAQARALLDCPAPGTHKARRVLEGIERLEKSGYFTAVRPVFQREETGAWRVAITLSENTPLARILIGGDYLSNLDEFRRILEEAGLERGSVFSAPALERAIRRYIGHLQGGGRFFFHVKHRVTTALAMDRGWVEFLLDLPHELDRIGVNAEVFFFRMETMNVIDIAVTGNRSVSTETILRQLGIRRGMTLRDDAALAAALRRINRLGIFSSVFFELDSVNRLQDCRLTIHLEEIESEKINTTVSLNSRNEFNLEVDYFDYSVNRGLDRLSLAAIFDFSKEIVDFFALYAIPDLWDDFFASAQFKKASLSAPFNQSWDQITTRIEIGLTLGMRFTGHFSGFVMLENHRTRLDFRSLRSEPAALPEGLFEGTISYGQHLKLVLLLDTLDDNFYPERGVRTFLSVSTLLFGNYSSYTMLDHKLEVYTPFTPSLTLAFYGHSAMLFSDDMSATLPLEERRKTSAQDSTVFEVSRRRLSLYAIFEFRYRFLDQFAACVFTESGAAWNEIGDASLNELAYGIGIGFRIAPRQHYYAHVFKYPWSVNIGINVSEAKETRRPVVLITSSRDELYYINLQAAF